jgi:hypothetical protein
MHAAADAVATEVADHAVAGRAGELSDCGSNVAKASAGSDNGDACIAAPAGGVHEAAGCLVRLADEEGRGGVTVKPSQLGGDVHVDDVPIQQPFAAGDPVTDDLVFAHAHGSWKAVVPELARPPALARRLGPDPLVNLGGPDAGRDARPHEREGFRGSPTGSTKGGQLFSPEKLDARVHSAPCAASADHVQYRFGMFARRARMI